MASKKHKIHKIMPEHPARDENIKRKQHFFSNAQIHMNNGHSVSVRVDESGIQLPSDFGNRAQAHNQRKNDSGTGFNNTSLMRRNKRIKMTNYHADHCNQDFWSETINAGGNTNELLIRKWSFNGAIGYKNKTASFRWVRCSMMCANSHILTFPLQTISSIIISIFAIRRFLYTKKSSHDVFEIVTEFNLRGGEYTRFDSHPIYAPKITIHFCSVLLYLRRRLYFIH